MISIVCLFIGFMGGLMASSLITPFMNISQFLSSTILNPVGFFFGMLCFFFGFIANAKLIRDCMEKTYALVKGARIHLIEVLIPYLVIINFAIHFFLNPQVGFAFLCFSLIYGMISIKINRYLPYLDRQKGL